MNFKGHAMVGAVVAIGATSGSLALNMKFQAALAMGAVAWLGSVAPDLDISSIPQRWFGRIGFMAAAIFYGLGSAARNLQYLKYSSLLGLLALFLAGMKHRGPTHKYWLPAALIALALTGSFHSEIIPIAFICFAAGHCSHLIADMIFPWSFKGWIL